jgi:hypothetical protein
VWPHHFHGVTALGWMLLLIAQSMLIDARDRRRHKWLGRAMFGPRYPAPLITVGVATLLEWAGYYLAPASPAWAAFGVAVAASPIWLVGGLGLAMGGADVAGVEGAPSPPRCTSRRGVMRCLRTRTQHRARRRGERPQQQPVITMAGGGPGRRCCWP